MAALMGNLNAAALLAGPPAPTDEERIRSLRHASNAAIAVHNSISAVEAMMTDTLIITSGGSLISGRERMQAAFLASFSDPQFIRYFRDPRKISVTGTVAMERGVWEGRWTHRSLRGCYLARWELVDDRWRIKAEMFVPADLRHCN